MSPLRFCPLKYSPIQTLARLAIALCLVLGITRPATAHETDQFTVPSGREFADVGEQLTPWAYNAIEKAVNRLNGRIRSEVASGRDGAEWQTPDVVASAVNGQFSAALFLIDGFDKRLLSRQAKEQYPGRLVGYKPSKSVRRYIDTPLNPFNAWECATINAYGVTFGTDKLGHFTDMGMHYYRAYRKALKAGASEDEARAAAVRLGTEVFIFAESGLLGWATAGGYSNADLVANFMGMVFYKNLTDPVMLKGEIRPPMIVRDGAYWKIAPHVTPSSGFFSLFISEHLDEALNPSFYLPKLRKGIRKAIVEHASDTLERYRDPNGNRRSERFFAQKVQELSSYWGVDYGHRGGEKDLLTIASTCFGELPQNADVGDRDRVGRTPLHRAAAIGDMEAMHRLISAGANVNATIRSKEDYSSEWGSTPLHLAAAEGQVEAAQLLIASGAAIDARNDRGATPLHRAVAQLQVAQLLLEHGADVNAMDVRGRTPLHWAANDPRSAALTLLVQRQGDPNHRDIDGQTPLHFAARTGNAPATQTLLAARADARITDLLGATPLHMAAQRNDPCVASALVRAGAPINAPDTFGCTPLHDAAQSQAETVVAMLLTAGATPQVANSHGVTPLELAARTGHSAIVELLRGDALATMDAATASWVDAPAGGPGSAPSGN